MQTGHSSSLDVLVRHDAGVVAPALKLRAWTPHYPASGRPEQSEPEVEELVPEIFVLLYLFGRFLHDDGAVVFVAFSIVAHQHVLNYSSVYYVAAD